MRGGSRQPHTASRRGDEKGVAVGKEAVRVQAPPLTRTAKKGKKNQRGEGTRAQLSEPSVGWCFLPLLFFPTFFFSFHSLPSHPHTCATREKAALLAAATAKKARTPSRALAHSISLPIAAACFLSFPISNLAFTSHNTTHAHTHREREGERERKEESPAMSNARGDRRALARSPRLTPLFRQ